MKKFLLSVTVAVVVALSANVCAAYDYDNDPYYVFVTTGQGVIYLDLRTVNVHDYNPPHYQIAGFFVWVSGFTDDERKYEIVLRYNWDTKETYFRDEGYWRKSRVSYEDTNSISNRRVADALFRAAYGMDFYGY